MDTLPEWDYSGDQAKNVPLDEKNGILGGHSGHIQSSGPSPVVDRQDPYIDEVVSDVDELIPYAEKVLFEEDEPFSQLEKGTSFHDGSPSLAD